ncbi:PPOX class F420-dependent oxidoreductase [Actinoplanes friuliensis]|uniref:Pyridoxamine 5'-phosphate oxidase-like protein n=1 Tax=Actinoplanes friuliensis DSM 7358 TaxID=1246995 RepID=U5W6E7_9ACTN|nr:PPOX class F420-dependent oxidoreductase [Actinoplanes friuliensis]AGZ44719.1 pyridoxamine 5'-phosphate oxidase-like protein [Actinoplanes friuliensis DSM 7358]
MISLDTLALQRTVLLETRKRDGSWVATPVSIVADAGRAYFRSYDAAGKAKRLRNFPQVRVAPCTMRGRPTGPAVAGSARLLSDEEAAPVRRMLAAKHPVLHGRLVPALHRRKGWTTLHYELTLEPS